MKKKDDKCLIRQHLDTYQTVILDNKKSTFNQVLFGLIKFVKIYYSTIVSTTTAGEKMKKLDTNRHKQINLLVFKNL